MRLQFIPGRLLFGASTTQEKDVEMDVEREAPSSTTGNVRWTDSITPIHAHSRDELEDPHLSYLHHLPTIPYPDSVSVAENTHRGTETPSETHTSTSQRRHLWRKLAALFEHSHPDLHTPTFRTLPIFSGIVVPFSILLAIPSLTGHWYIRTDIDNHIVDARPNPLLLDIGMITSMVCAVFASTCLVIRFAERGVKPMTYLCILLLTIHDLISITSVTIFGVVHRFDDGFIYGQSFWMAVCATLASTTTNITLIVDYARTPNFSKSGSGLTHKQRSLVVIVMILLFYIALGALVQSILLKLSFIDALYLTVVSIETIGFGDIHPTTSSTQAFTVVYTVFGILNLAVAVALTREALLEGVAMTLQKRIRVIRQQDRERRIRGRWRCAVKWRLRAKRLPMWIAEEKNGVIGHRFWRRMKLDPFLHALKKVFGKRHDANWRYTHGRHKRLNIEALTMSQLEAAALEAGAPLLDLLPPGFQENSGASETDNTNRGSRRPSVDSGANQPLTHVRMGGMVSLLGNFALAVGHGENGNFMNSLDDDMDDDDEEGSPPTTGHGVPLTRNLTMDDATLAASVELEEKSAFYARLSAALVFFFIFWMAGSAIFSKTEGWSFGSAVYFCFIAFTTIGYGDLAPKTAAGRSIFVVWALLGVATMTILIAIISEAYSNRYKQVIHTEIYQKNMGGFPDHTNGRSRYFSESQTMVGTMYTNGLPTAEPLSAASWMSKNNPGSPRSQSRNRGMSLGQASIYSAGNMTIPWEPFSAASSVGNHPMSPTSSRRGNIRKRAFSSAVDLNNANSPRSRLEGLVHHVLHHADTLKRLAIRANQHKTRSLEERQDDSTVISAVHSQPLAFLPHDQPVEQLDHTTSLDDDDELWNIQSLLDSIEASVQDIIANAKDAIEDLDVVAIP